MVKSIAAALLVASGCITGGNNGQTEPTQSAQPTQAVSRATFVCVGMENSERFGECPGCEIDATKMTNLFKNKYGYSGTTLISAQATKANVVKALKDAIARTGESDLLLFCYSGHGGQERLYGAEPEGADTPDEFLCLYDTYMLDDEIWDLVTTCKGRVFLYFDACHSATMYRSITTDVTARSADASPFKAEQKMEKTKGFTFRIRGQAMSADPKAPRLRMMCWSGCKESEYSYGSYAGGYMTRALMTKWAKGLTYDEVWNGVSKTVTSAQPDQHPVCTTVGGGFEGEAFR